MRELRGLRVRRRFDRVTAGAEDPARIGGRRELLCFGAKRPVIPANQLVPFESILRSERARRGRRPAWRPTLPAE